MHVCILAEEETFQMWAKVCKFPKMVRYPQASWVFATRNFTKMWLCDWYGPCFLKFEICEGANPVLAVHRCVGPSVGAQGEPQCGCALGIVA